MKLYPKEGTVVAIPTEPSGWVLGIYVRTKKGRSASAPFGYFFGRVYKDIPSASEITELRPEHSILQCKFGDLGLVEGRWKIIGSIEPWDRTNWPMPPLMIPADPKQFLNYDQLVRYDEDNPSRELFRESHPAGTLRLPLAAMPGSTALERKLSDIVNDRQPPFNFLTGGIPSSWKKKK